MRAGWQMMSSPMPADTKQFMFAFFEVGASATAYLRRRR